MYVNISGNISLNLLFDVLGETIWLTAEIDPWLVEQVYRRDLVTEAPSPIRYCADSGSN